MQKLDLNFKIFGMLCALCRTTEADKKNTHFLTDSVIRTCLNENGENVREKGFYFDISNNSAFVEFNFQRRTTLDKLKDTLGREPNEQEIEKAKQIPFSADNVFCSQCERKFTEIENIFLQKYLGSFRENNYKDSESVSIYDYKSIKLFFLLQVWRTSICDSVFELDATIAEQLRIIILNHESIKPEELNRFPLSVTYLNTDHSKSEKSATANFVGYTNDKNPNLIIMNDFIIQFFNSEESVTFFDFYNLNNKEDFHKYLNTESDKFIFKLLTHEQRLALLRDFITTDKVKGLVSLFSENFKKMWLALFEICPPQYLVDEYLTYLTKGSDENLLHYREENVLKLTQEFFQKYFR